MIKIFAPSDRDFTSNGDCVIDALKCRIFDNLDGDFYMELVCGAEYSDYMQAGDIIVADTPSGEQAFRIKTITKNRKKLEVKAWHIFYDTANYLIEGYYSQGRRTQEIMEILNERTDVESPFTMYSDVDENASYNFESLSLLDALKVIKSVWGGHFYRDNFEVSLLESLGEDRGVTIEYAKNLKDLTAEYDFSDVCTKILPIGKDGVKLDSVYLESDTQYDIPYSKVVTFSQDISRDDYSSYDVYIYALKSDLTRQARAYLASHKLPNINYTLKGLPEKITQIGDTILVKDERIGVEIETQVISYEYDSIQKKYINLEFGNFTKNLKDLISSVSQSSLNATMQVVDQASASVESDIKYKSGDSVTYEVTLPGYLTDTYSKIYTSMVLDKTYQGLTPTITRLDLTVYYVGGQCVEYGDITQDEDFSIEITRTSERIMSLEIDKSSRFVASNNRPVSLQVSINITF